MSRHLIGVDGRLWEWIGDRQNSELIPVQTDMIFNPKQQIIDDYCLTYYGELYHLLTHQVIDINYTLTSFNVLDNAIYATTDDKLLIKIPFTSEGRGRGRHIIVRPDTKNVSIINRNIDRIIITYLNRLVVIRDDQLLVVDRDEPGPEIVEGMLTVDQIITNRPGIIVTTQGVFSADYVDQLEFPDGIVDAIHIFEQGMILAVDEEGNIHTRDEEGEISTVDSHLLTQLNRDSQWMGFMSLEGYPQAGENDVGIFNKAGLTYMINDQMMITDINVQPEFHLGISSRRKGARQPARDQ